MTSICHRLPALRADGFWRFIAVSTLTLSSACTITPPQYSSSAVKMAPPASVSSVTLDQYRHAVARRIVERNPSYVLNRPPQPMLRSLVVVTFTVNRNGELLSSSVYRTNGDPEAEATALATLRRAAPLPPPPPTLLNAQGRIEMMEDWLFNDNGKFQLHTIAMPQAQAFDEAPRNTR
ncbi:MAG TPA: TonB family protein [Trinickia sp.]|jgi:protein TonB|uniref:TonB family protein n=1 Tax=Trinickia sp. TaxID=2571163 RepID=UPI002CBAAC73|nr:TonB family protein [Trinickia sp.]HTI16502.1 TonB family protein [Trinickia sp.]